MRKCQSRCRKDISIDFCDATTKAKAKPKLWRSQIQRCYGWEKKLAMKKLSENLLELRMVEPSQEPLLVMALAALFDNQWLLRTGCRGP